MFHLVQASLDFQKGVSAVAYILSKPISHGHFYDRFVAEQVAEVSWFLVNEIGVVCRGWHRQGMTACFAREFLVAKSSPHCDIVVTTKKTANDMPNTRVEIVCGKYSAAAAAGVWRSTIFVGVGEPMPKQSTDN